MMTIPLWQVVVCFFLGWIILDVFKFFIEKFKNRKPKIYKNQCDWKQTDPNATDFINSKPVLK